MSRYSNFPGTFSIVCPIAFTFGEVTYACKFDINFLIGLTILKYSKLDRYTAQQKIFVFACYKVLEDGILCEELINNSFLTVVDLF